MNPRTARLLRWTLTGVVLVMLALFARRVEWVTTWRAMRTADWTLLLAALVVNLVSAGTKAIRWWIFLRPVGVRSLGLATRATFAGLGLNNVLVANGGDAAKVVFVAREAHVPSATVLATVALERLFEMIGYVVLLAAAPLLLPLPPSLTGLRPWAFGALVGIGALLVYLVRRPEAEAAIAPVPTRWMDHARAYWGRFVGTLGGISTGPRFVGALATSVAGWALQVWTYQLTADSAQLGMPLIGTISAILAVNVGFALKVTPGNVGLFQLMYAATAGVFGVDTDRAIAVGFLIQAQQIVPVTLIGIAMAPGFVFGARGRRGETVPVESRGD